MDFLVFRLYAPLAAWGGIAVGQERPSDAYPGKSAIVGLLGAALGIRRDEDARLAALAGGYGYGVRVEADGVVLRDYHTAQVPSRVDLKGRPHRTRRDELAPPRAVLNTILSFREYRCDALSTVALWSRAAAPYALDALAAALRRPRFVLSLGRKSCAPSLPLEPQIVAAATFDAALDSARFAGDLWLRGEPDPLGLTGRGVMHGWDVDAPVGHEAQMTVVRRDEPRSRRRWQFGERPEVQCRGTTGGAT